MFFSRQSMRPGLRAALHDGEVDRDWLAIIGQLMLGVRPLPRDSHIGDGSSHGQKRCQNVDRKVNGYLDIIKL